jgi:putative hydrolase of the HAD superfamily
MNVAAVLFDFYGTLVDDFASSVGRTHMDFVKILGVPEESFRKLWRKTTDMRVTGAFQTVEASIEHVAGQLGARLTEPQLSRAVSMRLEMIRQTLCPKADALETLATLKRQGYKTGLLSNCSIEIPLLWIETPFAGLFDALIFSSRERLKKPHPDIYRLACERLGVAPDQCLYIADGENYELAAAAKVGLRTALIRNREQDVTRELHREAREWQGLTIEELSQIPHLVNVAR